MLCEYAATDFRWQFLISLTANCHPIFHHSWYFSNLIRDTDATNRWQCHLWTRFNEHPIFPSSIVLKTYLYFMHKNAPFKEHEMLWFSYLPKGGISKKRTPIYQRLFIFTPQCSFTLTRSSSLAAWSAAMRRSRLLRRTSAFRLFSFMLATTVRANQPMRQPVKRILTAGKSQDVDKSSAKTTKKAVTSVLVMNRCISL